MYNENAKYLRDMTAKMYKKEIVRLSREVAFLYNMMEFRENLERGTGRTTQLLHRVWGLCQTEDNKVLVIHPTHPQKRTEGIFRNQMNIGVDELNTTEIGRGLRFTHVVIDPSAWVRMTEQGVDHLQQILVSNRIYPYS